MTYLELVQMTAQQSGTIQGVLPSTVFGQSNRLKLIVDFVSEAYVDIQNAHRQWRWLQSTFVKPFFVGENSSFYDENFIDENDGENITRFSQWGFKGDGSDIGLSMYLAAETDQTGEGPLRWLDWDRFYETQLRGVQTLGKPQFYTVTPENGIYLSPNPDDAYMLRGKYRKSPQMLVADADEPEMPEEFHIIIKDAALCYLEGYDEGPRISINRLRMLPNWSMLEHLQLPKPKWGAPLA